MPALVIYESIYGNTRAIAEAIAEGLGGVEVLPVHEAPRQVHEAVLLVVGGPTHVHGLSTPRSRRSAVETGERSGTRHAEPGRSLESGLRDWIRDLPETHGAAAAAFDTRANASVLLSGAASHGIAKRLRRRGYEVLSTASFAVEGVEGPLVTGELERARAWGRELRESFTALAKGAAA